MKKKLALIAAIFLFGAAACAQEDRIISIDYVALGDSLAAGQTPYSEIDSGYTDMIAQKLESEKLLNGYTKALAVPGYTTEDVLKQLNSEKAKEAMQTADLVTISAGANDLLQLVRLNPASGEIEFDQVQVDKELEDVRINLETMLIEVKKQAPAASIYLMGYYFPFPHIEDSRKSEIAGQLDKLNETLKNVAEQQEANFVPVADAFEDDATEKLPNATDIHPNQEGYEAMAEAFWAEYESR